MLKSDTDYDADRWSRNSYITPKKKSKKRIKNRNNKQRQFYSGKKRRYVLKTQVILYKKTKQVICTAFANGKYNDFMLFKESKTKVNSDIKIITDNYIKVYKSFIISPNYQKRRLGKYY